jgi:hypothetical protein
MNEPEIGRDYFLVRKVNGLVETWRFERFADGSACLAPVGWIRGIYENDPDAWRIAWKEVRTLRLVSVEEGIRLGILTAEEAARLTNSPSG